VIKDLKECEITGNKIGTIYNTASWVQGVKFATTLAVCLPVTIASLPLRLIPNKIHEKASEPSSSFFTRAVSSVKSGVEDWTIVGAKHSYISVKFLRASSKYFNAEVIYNAKRQNAQRADIYTAEHVFKKTIKRMLGFNSGHRSSIASRINAKKHTIQAMSD